MLPGGGRQGEYVKHQRRTGAVLNVNLKKTCVQ